jgi:hypothetical protein
MSSYVLSMALGMPVAILYFGSDLIHSTGNFLKANPLVSLGIISLCLLLLVPPYVSTWRIITKRRAPRNLKIAPKNLMDS